VSFDKAKQQIRMSSMMTKNMTLVVYRGGAAGVSYAHSNDSISKSNMKMLITFRTGKKLLGHGKFSREKIPRDWIVVTVRPNAQDVVSSVVALDVSGEFML